MKILMLTPSYSPIVGGTESVVQDLAVKLNEIGIHTDIMTFNMNEKWNPIWREEVKENDFKVFRVPAFNIFHKLPYNPLEFLFNVNVIPKLNFTKRLKDYDILHFHDEVDLSFPLFSYFNKNPKIFHFHTLYFTYLYFYRKYMWCRRILRMVAQHYICNASESLKLLVDLGIDREKITIIPNAIDLKKFSPFIFSEDGLYRYEEKVHVDHNAKKIVYVSRLDSSKLDAIINIVNMAPKIVKEVPNTQIIIVGNGPSFGEVNKLIKKINRQLYRKVVIMAGLRRDIEKIMNLADIVIGTGRVALEAMACGKPVIIVGSLVGSFGGAFGGIVTKDNVIELKNYNFSGRNSSKRITSNRIAEAAIKLLTDEKYRRLVGNFSRWFVEKEHDIQKIAEQIEAIYRNFLES